MKINELETELRNPRTMELDNLPVLEMVRLINAENQKVAEAVKSQDRVIAQVVEEISKKFNMGGRIIYCGAGTSGRLGILDAVELVPTYGLKPDQAIGLIAGGAQAVYKAVEGAEDSIKLARQDLKRIDLNSYDSVIAIAASGRTPYAIGALDYANEIGALSVALVCVSHSEMEEHAKYTIAPVVGPEVVTGSTRMKAGSAQKMVLNTISTGVMVKSGKVYQNLMINVLPTNEKLVERAVRIIAETTGCSDEEARKKLKEAKQSVPIAIVMQKKELNYEDAQKLLIKNDNKVIEALR
ncbi:MULTISPECIES: N-acetylmuramic acid 6-phosphate etherase [Liquorilactobacillus]|nr:N-acetylmuramic acid 6-phosphate etherase [Liquorilactobacillus mali]MDN7145362.1 N-acetylmuramic acid 6-phosphate etherase [Liquorilactobacillus mali]